MFALGAQHAINGHSEDYMDLAKELAKTCHESYQRTGKLLAMCFMLSNHSGNEVKKIMNIMMSFSVITL